METSRANHQISHTPSLSLLDRRPRSHLVAEQVLYRHKTSRSWPKRTGQEALCLLAKRRVFWFRCQVCAVSVPVLLGDLGTRVRLCLDDEAALFSAWIYAGDLFCIVFGQSADRVLRWRLKPWMSRAVSQIGQHMGSGEHEWRDCGVKRGVACTNEQRPQVGSRLPSLGSSSSSRRTRHCICG
jgi:hypothetical protein